MNSYIDAQCRSMIALINTFVHSCEMGAKKDDGIISPDEAKALKQIHKASEKFKSQITKIIA